MGNANSLVSINNQEDRNIAFEQYKKLVDYLHNLNQIRESSNNFWMTVNALGISAIAYIRDADSVANKHKPFLLWTLIILGLILCLAWRRGLSNIKDTVESKTALLIDLESYLPAKVFGGNPPEPKERKVRKHLLTTKEMLVPNLFILGYAFFMILLILFPHETVMKIIP